MKSLSFVLVILTLLSCVFSKSIDLSSNDEEINSSWKTVFELLNNLNIPVDYMLQDMETLVSDPSLTIKDSLVMNSVITHLFDNENILKNENGLQRRKKDECHCNCPLAGFCQCDCASDIVAISEGEKKCFKKATGIDLDKLTIEVDGAFSIIKLIYKVMLSPLNAVAAVVNYEVCLIVILTLLSCVFSKNIALSSNDENEEINYSWKTVFELLNNLNSPIDYMFQDMETLVVGF
ncbi:hypothetical protein BCR32DRAFT_295397 [Anaeromyces robustus]|uniref:Uncharacterized protein n=1 Tax=Anaeromyces robustus TaxID=1754192 RepID=A0A1Y1WX60_9FUNG|nr:hypothetical protein BCR32DRAFT_295397 [Anaeromyces robustus]|eukprot:ORX77796.1 hypothetical protein BCR32DRAFT_295397 [Anaeromyces robustus]